MVYIKYEQKWMIFNELEEEHTYFLECDASINALDVTQCDKKWKGDPNKDWIDIRSIDCSQNNTESIEWSKDTNDPNMAIRHRRTRAIVFTIIGVFFLCSAMLFGFLGKRKYDEKNPKFDRLSDVEVDDDDDDIGLDNTDPE